MYEKQMPMNGDITIGISNLTAFVFVRGNNLFSFYPKRLSYEELKDLLVENFKEDGIYLPDSDMECICEKIHSYFKGGVQVE